MLKIFKVEKSYFLTLALLLGSSTACSTTNINQEYFGKTESPGRQVLRYVSGSEPESLDPQISSGQPEARIYMALYEGLVEYDPQTSAPIPALAETWEVNRDSSELTFHLRKDGKWSNGDAITAHDFVYSLRRGLDPTFASRNAYLAYYIKYAQGYNEGSLFVRNPQTGQFLLEKDYQADAAAASAEASTAAAANVSQDNVTLEPQSSSSEQQSGSKNSAEDAAPETQFHLFIRSPARLRVAPDEKKRAKELAVNPKLRAALAAGAELVPIKAEDVGVEAVDDYTVRLTLAQSAPYFIGLVAHQFFRLVPRRAIEQHGARWTDPGNIVTCGAFKLESHKPYHELTLVRDPNYWDAANVRLERIEFYPVEDSTTILNLYKAGEIDAFYNHVVPSAWYDQVRNLKDYMDEPENAILYYVMNTTRAPTDDVRVRKAFNMAIDKEALAQYMPPYKPLTAFSPEGIFPGYPQPKGDAFNPQRAKELLVEAGYGDAAGNFDPGKFPISEVELTYNTAGSNKKFAEFMQAQWKQNLELTVPMKNMEAKTLNVHRTKLEYKGFTRLGWNGDYMDPYTYLGLFASAGGENSTGWFDPKYVEMLNEANTVPDQQQRYAMLAKAESYLLEQQPIIPLVTYATNWMKKPYVKGMYPNPLTLHPWKFIYIENDRAQWNESK